MTLKPFLRYGYGDQLWRCYLKGTSVIGWGYTALEAWEEYLREMRKVWRRFGLPEEGMGN